jgi:cytochrome c oxidase subunit 3
MARRKPQLHSSKAALAEQFDDLEQQHEASSLGMWVFLATEVMFFGGLFTAYIIYRNAYLPAFEAGSRLLDVRIGAFNTAVLLCSSLTMALGVRAAQMGKKGALVTFLILTLLLGLVFVGVKLVFEWRHDYLEGFAPGVNWTFNGPDWRHVELFFCFYFFLTGIHALHMLIGVGVLTTLIIMAQRGRFSPERYNAVEMSGLYWHFVDVWIFLFPLLYLIGGRY